MVKRFLASVAIGLAAMLSSTAMAQQMTIDTSNLSSEQLAMIKEASAPKKEHVIDTSLASKWGTEAATAASGFATAIGIAAREIGVTANEFLGTPAGKLAAALIVWKVIGDDVVKIIGWSIFMIVPLFLSGFIIRRTLTSCYVTVEYTYLWGLLKGQRQKRVPCTIGNIESDGEWLMLFIAIVIVVIPTLITAGNLV